MKKIIKNKMTLVKRIVAGLTALSTALTMASPVFGVTLEEFLQQILNYLQQNPQVVQQIQQMAPQVIGQLAGVPAACQGITFTRNLSVGATGADVKCLQALLNQSPDTQVAASGVGSPGNETTYFGPLTAAAVKKFQEKYASEILTPLGLTAGTGFVGPSTRAKLNQLLTPQLPQLPQIELPTPEEREEVTPEEGVLEVSVAPEPYGVEVVPGETKKVVGFEFEAKDSDITIQRMDLFFKLTGGVTETRPWKLLDYVTIYDGTKAIKGVDAVRDNFVSITSGDYNTYYRLRFSGLSVKVAKGQTKTIEVEVETLSTYEETPTVKVGTEMRYIDTAGVTQTVALPQSEAPSFDVTSAVAGDVTVKLNSASPEGIVLVSREDTTRDVTLASFDIKAKNTEVTLDEVGVSITGNTYLTYVKLYDGNTLLKRLSSGSSLTFSDLEIKIAKDATKTLTVKADVTKLTSAQEGALVSVTLTSLHGEDANEEEINKTSLNVAGKNRLLYTVYPELALVDGTIASSSSGINAVIKFKVTAQGGNVYLPGGATILAWNSTSSTWTDPVADVGLVDVGDRSLYQLTASAKTNGLHINGSKTIQKVGTVEEQTPSSFVYWVKISDGTVTTTQPTTNQGDYYQVTISKFFVAPEGEAKQFELIAGDIQNIAALATWYVKALTWFYEDENGDVGKALQKTWTGDFVEFLKTNRLQ